MARSPFEINASTHFMSAYMARVGKIGVVGEARISVAGWTSQHAIIPKPIAGYPVIVDDLLGYGRSRSVVESKLTEALKPVVNAINGASDISLFNDGVRWCVGPNGAMRNYDNACGRAAALFQSLADSYQSGSGEDCMAVDSGGGGQYGGVMFVNWAPMLAARKPLQVLIPRISDEMLNRLTDTMSWYMDKLESCGFSRSDLNFKGFIGLNYSVSPLSATQLVGGNTRGVLTIIGPKDSYGLHPVHQCATTGKSGLLWILPSQMASNTSRVANMLFRVYNSDIVSPSYKTINTALTSGGWDGKCVQNVSNDSGQSVLISLDGGAMYVGPKLKGSIILSMRQLTGAPSGAVPAAILANFFGADDRVITDTIPNPCYYRSSTHSWVLPKGCTALSLFAGEVLSSLDTRGLIKKITVKPTICGFTMTVAAISDYFSEQSNNTALSAADRKSCSDTVEKLKPYIDGLISTTVYAAGFKPPSRLDINNLYIVKEAASAGVNLLTEKIDRSGATLEDFVKVVDADRSEGKTYYNFAKVTDESATVEELVSTDIARTIGNAGAWVLSFPVGSDGTTLVGSYGGGSAVGLTKMEVVLLYLAGASVPAGVDDAFVIKTLGFPTSFRSDLMDLITGGHLKPSGNSWWGGTCVQGGLVLDPAKFTNSDGYPVIDYIDSDSRNRAMLLYKGSKSDASNLTCMMFFTNTL